MPGGLIQVVAYGSQDLFLTSTPEITYFKTVYRRYTNFSFDTINIPFDTAVGFGETSQVNIPKVGDLIHKMYLQIQIPSVYLTRTTNSTEITNAQNNLTLAQNNYTAVKNFMEVNIQSYRNANSAYIAVNSSKQNLIDAINNTFNSLDPENTITSAFANVLQNINVVETPVNFNYYSISMADLINRSDVTGMTISQLYGLLTYGIEQSQKVDYFFYQQILDCQNILDDVKNTNRKFAWVNKLGHSIIDYVEVTIGGTNIDKQYGRWIDIWFELTGNKNQQDTYNIMIGNTADMTTYNRETKPTKTLFIPLQFWFNRNNGLAIPLVSLEYHDVAIITKIRPVQDIAYTELLSDETYVYLDDLFADNGYNIDMSLLVDFYYLDGPERRKFAQGSHEYLIEQIQEIDITNYNTTNTQITIDFFHPCKEIYWIAQKNSYITNTNGDTKCQWTNYGLNDTTGQGNTVVSSELFLNGYTRIDKKDGNYFNYVQPNTYHTNTPSDGINSYSFAINPEEHQPSGTCNFSRISNALLALTLDNSSLTYTQTISGTIQNLHLNTLTLTPISQNVVNYVGSTIDISSTYQYAVTNYDSVNNIVTVSGDISNTIYYDLSYVITDSSANTDTGTISEINFNQINIDENSKNVAGFYNGWTMQLGTYNYTVSDYDNINNLIILDDYVQKYTVVTGETYILTKPPEETNINIYVYALNYNILRFISGMAGLAYT